MCAHKVPNALSFAFCFPSSGKYDGKSILMVTDASGLPLGFDVLDGGWSCLCNADFAQGEGSGSVRTFYKIVTLLQRCMDAPMGGGMPRQPKRLRVNDKILHRWGRKISSILTCSHCQFMSQFNLVIGPIMTPHLNPADVTADVVKRKLMSFKALVVSKDLTWGLWVILGAVKKYMFASVRWCCYSCHSGVVFSLSLFLLSIL